MKNNVTEMWPVTWVRVIRLLDKFRRKKVLQGILKNRPMKGMFTFYSPASRHG